MTALRLLAIINARPVPRRRLGFERGMGLAPLTEEKKEMMTPKQAKEYLIEKGWQPTTAGRWIHDYWADRLPTMDMYTHEAIALTALSMAKEQQEGKK